MLIHAAPDRQLKKKGVDVDICREVLVMEVMMMLMILMMKRLDDFREVLTAFAVHLKKEWFGKKDAP